MRSSIFVSDYQCIMYGVFQKQNGTSKVTFFKTILLQSIMVVVQIMRISKNANNKNYLQNKYM